jgi:hypothetical protein
MSVHFLHNVVTLQIKCCYIFAIRVIISLHYNDIMSVHFEVYNGAYVGTYEKIRGTFMVTFMGTFWSSGRR